MKIYPRCKAGKQAYVDCEGRYFPCCWLGSAPIAEIEKTPFLNDEFFNVKNNKPKDIKKSEELQAFYESLNDFENAPFQCRYHCNQPISEKLGHINQDYGDLRKL